MGPEPRSILDSIFITGDFPVNAELGSYILPLVLLSYLIATLGSLTGLRLASEIHNAKTNKLKNRLHYGGAFAFATGISMTTRTEAAYTRTVMSAAVTPGV